MYTIPCHLALVSKPQVGEPSWLSLGDVPTPPAEGPDSLAWAAHSGRGVMSKRRLGYYYQRREKEAGWPTTVSILLDFFMASTSGIAPVSRKGSPAQSYFPSHLTIFSQSFFFFSFFNISLASVLGFPFLSFQRVFHLLITWRTTCMLLTP